MGQVLIVTLGTRGDVVSYAALGSALAAAGDQVTIATHASLRMHVERQGLGFVALPVEVTVGGVPLTSARFARLLAARWTEIGRALVAAADGMDVLLLAPMGWLGYHVAQATGAASMGCFLQPLEPTSAFPPPMLTTRDLGGWGNRAAARAFRLLGQAPFARATAELRCHLGLPPSGPAATFRQMDQERWPILYGLSPSVVPTPPDWPAHRPLTGYWWPSTGAGLSDRVRRFLDDGEPPVFLGFGSTSAHGLDNVVAETVSRLGRRVIVQQRAVGPAAEHMGGSAAGHAVGPAAERADGWKVGRADVLVIGEEPHAELFPRVAAIVHHGGAGTTAAALRAGVPSVTVPFTADQPFWARRVADLGAGPPPIPLRRVTAGRLADAIGGAEAYREGAVDLSRRLAVEDGIGTAVALIRGLSTLAR